MKKFLISVIILLVLVVGLEIGILVYRDYTADTVEPTTEPTVAVTQAPITEVPTTQAPTTEAPTTEVPTEIPTTQVPTTEAPTQAPTEMPTEAPTEVPTQPTEPESTSFLLTFAGNCTLGSPKNDAKNSASFVSVVGENYSHPFQKVQEYFSNDDFTMVNLEGVLADEGTPAAKEYTFIGPSAYANILTQGGVEAVSLANDHTGDFGTAGYKATKESLDKAGVAYAEDDKTILYTTESGLKIGVCAITGNFYSGEMKKDIAALKKQGAEVIVAFFHWGSMNDYYPSKSQTSFAHAAVDVGADIVIGTGPHVLQKIENYKGHYICYSLGNFSYGGIKWLTDQDTAFVQLEVFRDAKGNIELGELRIIPCAMTSSGNGQNNFQPLPLDTGYWQYNAVIRKLSEPVSSATTAATEAATGSTAAPTEPAVETPTEAPTQATAPAQSNENTTPDVPDVNDPQA